MPAKTVLLSGLIAAATIGAIWVLARPSVPACRGAYSKTGDQKSVDQLVKDFKATVTLVRKHDNRILLSEAVSIVEKHNLRAMEEWTCRAQRQYGRP